MKPALLAGTVVSYLGINAVVIEDGPTEFLVLCEGNRESWWWECDGHTCEIVAYPSGSSHYHQPASTVQNEDLDAYQLLAKRAEILGRPLTWEEAIEITADNATTVQGGSSLVGYIRRSAIELMENDELGVRANIIKEPRYQDCVVLYTASQPAEQSACPVCHGEGLRLNPLTEVPVLCANCNGGQQPECGSCGQTDRCDDDCDTVVIGGHRAAEQQPAPDVAGLVEALQNMLGAFDTPIVRRKVGSVFSEEAIGSAHAALAAYHKQGGEAGK